MDIGILATLQGVIFLVLDLYILIKIYAEKNKSEKHRVFRGLISSTVGYQAFSALVRLLKNDILNLSVALTYVIYMAMFIFMAVCSYFFFLYLLAIKKDSVSVSMKLKLIFSAFADILIVLTLISPWMHWVFSIDGNADYHRGSAFFLQYTCTYLYVLFAIGLLVEAFVRKNEKKKRALVLNFLCFLIPSVVCTLLQIFLPFDGGYTAIGVSLSTIFMYLQIYMEQLSEAKGLKDVAILNEKLSASNERQKLQIQKITSLNKNLMEYDAILSNAGFGTWRIVLKDGQPPRMKANPKMRELLGIGDDLNEVEIYHAWYDHIVPDALPSVQASVNEMIAGSFSENTYLWNHPEKGAIYVRCGGTCENLPDGSHVLSGYHADVTSIVEDEIASKKKMEALNKDLEHQMVVVGGLTNAYFAVYGTNLHVYGGNFIPIKEIDFTREMFKTCFTAPAAIAAFVAHGVAPEDIERVREFMNLSTLPERLMNVDSLSMEFHGIYKNYEWCRISWIVSKRDENGVAYRIILAAEEISASLAKRRAQQKELEDARIAAETASKAKTTFLFNMSHDIRTPMNAIMGFTELIKKNNDNPEKILDYIGKVESSSKFLLSLINNVLEVARIESENSKLDETVTDVDEFDSTICSLFDEQMKKKNIAFTRTLIVDHHFVFADQVKVKEIILNLLSNAYKYTPSGGAVRMSLHELPSEDPKKVLFQIKVEDTGIGMSKEFLPHLFEDFSRERTVTDSKIEGTGLGMPIVKKMVDLMGGRIIVTSEPGLGSTFTVLLSHTIADGSELKKKKVDDIDKSAFTNRRILLAEDNDLNAEIAMTVLQEVGFAVERAADGVVCVDMLQRSLPYYYDVILMDIQMPNLDGYKATSIIRSMNDPFKKNIPIIAMTANAFEEDKKNALAAGMNGHLAKPIEVPKLLETLAEILK